ncbi:MAG: tetratricopeptide repeat protein, partial [Candidatus Rokuibacteriota bacterium]
LWQGGDLVAARRAYERAIELDPNYALAYLNVGRLYLKEGRPELAERAFRTVLLLEPDSSSARRGLETALGMQQQGAPTGH